MPSQGSAMQADGPPLGDAKSHPTMPERRERERERRWSKEVWKISLDGKEEGPESRTNRKSKRREGTVEP